MKIYFCRLIWIPFFSIIIPGTDKLKEKAPQANILECAVNHLWLYLRGKQQNWLAHSEKLTLLLFLLSSVNDVGNFCQWHLHNPFFFLFSFGADVSSMPARVCGMASALHAHLSDTLIDTRGFNPLLLSKCVRCAVKQRCWRISRNAILQGGKSGAAGGQREGSMRTVKTFYLHGRWVGALSWSRSVASRTREVTGNKCPGEESSPQGE